MRMPGWIGWIYSFVILCIIFHGLSLSRSHNWNWLLCCIRFYLSQISISSPSYSNSMCNLENLLFLGKVLTVKLLVSLGGGVCHVVIYVHKYECIFIAMSLCTTTTVAVCPKISFEKGRKTTLVTILCTVPTSYSLYFSIFPLISFT